MKAPVIFLLTLLTVAGHSQNTINSYKYVILPQRFEFLRADDQYSLNTTTKSLLEEKGFTVLWSNGNLPPAVAANKCTALVTEVTQRKAMFSTNLTVVLKDCLGNTIFKSKEGKSREKEFYIAYDHALRDAFTSLNDVPYKYDSTLSAQSAQLPQQPVQMQQPTQTQPQQPAQPQPAQPQQQPAQPQPAQPQQQPTQPQPQPASAPTATEITGTLYAQAIPNGYQLIDTSPKKVLTLLKTSTQDYYLAQSATFTGLVFKKNGDWLFEYYKDDKLISQKLDIKF
jgi:cell division septation protein DedD